MRFFNPFWLYMAFWCVFNVTFLLVHALDRNHSNYERDSILQKSSQPRKMAHPLDLKKYMENNFHPNGTRGARSTHHTTSNNKRSRTENVPHLSYLGEDSSTENESISVSMSNLSRVSQTITELLAQLENITNIRDDTKIPYHANRMLHFGTFFKESKNSNVNESSETVTNFSNSKGNMSKFIKTVFHMFNDTGTTSPHLMGVEFQRVLGVLHSFTSIFLNSDKEDRDSLVQTIQIWNEILSNSSVTVENNVNDLIKDVQLFSRTQTDITKEEENLYKYVMKQVHILKLKTAIKAHKTFTSPSGDVILDNTDTDNFAEEIRYEVLDILSLIKVLNKTDCEQFLDLFANKSFVELVRKYERDNENADLIFVRALNAFIRLLTFEARYEFLSNLRNATENPILHNHTRNETFHLKKMNNILGVKHSLSGRNNRQFQVYLMQITKEILDTLADDVLPRNVLINFLKLVSDAEDEMIERNTTNPSADGSRKDENLRERDISGNGSLFVEFKSDTIPKIGSILLKRLQGMVKYASTKVSNNEESVTSKKLRLIDELMDSYNIIAGKQSSSTLPHPENLLRSKLMEIFYNVTNVEGDILYNYENSVFSNSFLNIMQNLAKNSRSNTSIIRNHSLILQQLVSHQQSQHMQSSRNWNLVIEDMLLELTNLVILDGISDLLTKTGKLWTLKGNQSEENFWKSQPYRDYNDNLEMLERIQNGQNLLTEANSQRSLLSSFKDLWDFEHVRIKRELGRNFSEKGKVFETENFSEGSKNVSADFPGKEYELHDDESVSNFFNPTSYLKLDTEVVNYLVQHLNVLKDNVTSSGKWDALNSLSQISGLTLNTSHNSYNSQKFMEGAVELFATLPQKPSKTVKSNAKSFGTTTKSTTDFQEPLSTTVDELLRNLSSMLANSASYYIIKHLNFSNGVHVDEPERRKHTSVLFALEKVAGMLHSFDLDSEFKKRVFELALLSNMSKTAGEMKDEHLWSPELKETLSLVDAIYMATTNRTTEVGKEPDLKKPVAFAGKLNDATADKATASKVTGRMNTGHTEAWNKSEPVTVFPDASTQVLSEKYFTEKTTLWKSNLTEILPVEELTKNKGVSQDAFNKRLINAVMNMAREIDDKESAIDLAKAIKNVKSRVEPFLMSTYDESDDILNALVRIEKMLAEVEPTVELFDQKKMLETISSKPNTIIVPGNAEFLKKATESTHKLAGLPTTEVSVMTSNVSKPVSPLTPYTTMLLSLGKDMFEEELERLHEDAAVLADLRTIAEGIIAPDTESELAKSILASAVLMSINETREGLIDSMLTPNGQTAAQIFKIVLESVNVSESQLILGGVMNIVRKMNQTDHDIGLKERLKDLISVLRLMPMFRDREVENLYDEVVEINKTLIEPKQLEELERLHEDAAVLADLRTIAEGIIAPDTESELAKSILASAVLMSINETREGLIDSMLTPNGKTAAQIFKIVLESVNVSESQLILGGVMNIVRKMNQTDHDIGLKERLKDLISVLQLMPMFRDHEVENLYDEVVEINKKLIKPKQLEELERLHEDAAVLADLRTIAEGIIAPDTESELAKSILASVVLMSINETREGLIDSMLTPNGQTAAQIFKIVLESVNVSESQLILGGVMNIVRKMNQTDHDIGLKERLKDLISLLRLIPMFSERDLENLFDEVVGINKKLIETKQLEQEVTTQGKTSSKLNTTIISATPRMMIGNTESLGRVTKMSEKLQELSAEVTETSLNLSPSLTTSPYTTSSFLQFDKEVLDKGSGSRRDVTAVLSNLSKIVETIIRSDSVSELAKSFLAFVALKDLYESRKGMNEEYAWSPFLELNETFEAVDSLLSVNKQKVSETIQRLAENTTGTEYQRILSEVLNISEKVGKAEPIILNKTLRNLTSSLKAIPKLADHNTWQLSKEIVCMVNKWAKMKSPEEIVESSKRVFHNATVLKNQHIVSGLMDISSQMNKSMFRGVDFQETLKNLSSSLALFSNLSDREAVKLLNELVSMAKELAVMELMTLETTTPSTMFYNATVSEKQRLLSKLINLTRQMNKSRPSIDFDETFKNLSSSLELLPKLSDNSTWKLFKTFASMEKDSAEMKTIKQEQTTHQTFPVLEATVFSPTWTIENGNVGPLGMTTVELREQSTPELEETSLTLFLSQTPLTPSSISSFDKDAVEEEPEKRRTETAVLSALSEIENTMIRSESESELEKGIFVLTVMKNLIETREEMSTEYPWLPLLNLNETLLVVDTLLTSNNQTMLQKVADLLENAIIKKNQDNLTEVINMVRQMNKTELGHDLGEVAKKLMSTLKDIPMLDNNSMENLFKGLVPKEKNFTEPQLLQKEATILENLPQLGPTISNPTETGVVSNAEGFGMITETADLRAPTTFPVTSAQAFLEETKVRNMTMAPNAPYQRILYEVMNTTRQVNKSEFGLELYKVIANFISILQSLPNPPDRKIESLLNDIIQMQEDLVTGKPVEQKITTLATSPKLNTTLHRRTISSVTGNTEAIEMPTKTSLMASLSEKSKNLPVSHTTSSKYSVFIPIQEGFGMTPEMPQETQVPAMATPTTTTYPFESTQIFSKAGLTAEGTLWKSYLKKATVTGEQAANVTVTATASYERILSDVMNITRKSNKSYSIKMEEALKVLMSDFQSLPTFPDLKVQRLLNDFVRMLENLTTSKPVKQEIATPETSSEELNTTICSPTQTNMTGNTVTFGVTTETPSKLPKQWMTTFAETPFFKFPSSQETSSAYLVFSPTQINVIGDAEGFGTTTETAKEMQVPSTTLPMKITYPVTSSQTFLKEGPGEEDTLWKNNLIKSSTTEEQAQNATLAPTASYQHILSELMHIAGQLDKTEPGLAWDEALEILVSDLQLIPNLPDRKRESLLNYFVRILEELITKVTTKQLVTITGRSPGLNITTSSPTQSNRIVNAEAFGETTETSKKMEEEFKTIFSETSSNLPSSQKTLSPPLIYSPTQMNEINYAERFGTTTETAKEMQVSSTITEYPVTSSQIYDKERTTKEGTLWESYVIKSPTTEKPARGGTVSPTASNQRMVAEVINMTRQLNKTGPETKVEEALYLIASLQSNPKLPDLKMENLKDYTRMQQELSEREPVDEGVIILEATSPNLSTEFYSSTEKNIIGNTKPSEMTAGTSVKLHNQSTTKVAETPLNIPLYHVPSTKLKLNTVVGSTVATITTMRMQPTASVVLTSQPALIGKTSPESILSSEKQVFSPPQTKKLTYHTEAQKSLNERIVQKPTNIPESIHTTNYEFKSIKENIGLLKELTETGLGQKEVTTQKPFVMETSKYVYVGEKSAKPPSSLSPSSIENVPWTELPVVSGTANNSITTSISTAQGGPNISALSGLEVRSRINISSLERVLAEHIEDETYLINELRENEARAKDMFKNISESIHELTRIVHDLLDFKTSLKEFITLEKDKFILGSDMTLKESSRKKSEKVAHERGKPVISNIVRLHEGSKQAPTLSFIIDFIRKTFDNIAVNQVHESYLSASSKANKTKKGHVIHYAMDLLSRAPEKDKNRRFLEFLVGSNMSLHETTRMFCWLQLLEPFEGQQLNEAMSRRLLHHIASESTERAFMRQRLSNISKYQSGVSSMNALIDETFVNITSTVPYNDTYLADIYLGSKMQNWIFGRKHKGIVTFKVIDFLSNVSSNEDNRRLFDFLVDVNITVHQAAKLCDWLQLLNDYIKDRRLNESMTKKILNTIISFSKEEDYLRDKLHEISKYGPDLSTFIVSLTQTFAKIVKHSQNETFRSDIRQAHQLKSFIDDVEHELNTTFDIVDLWLRMSANGENHRILDILADSNISLHISTKLYNWLQLLDIFTNYENTSLRWFTNASQEEKRLNVSVGKKIKEKVSSLSKERSYMKNLLIDLFEQENVDEKFVNISFGLTVNGSLESRNLSSFGLTTTLEAEKKQTRLPEETKFIKTLVQTEDLLWQQILSSENLKEDIEKMRKLIKLRGNMTFWAWMETISNFFNGSCLNMEKGQVELEMPLLKGTKPGETKLASVTTKPMPSLPEASKTNTPLISQQATKPMVKETEKPFGLRTMQTSLGGEQLESISQSNTAFKMTGKNGNVYTISEDYATNTRVPEIGGPTKEGAVIGHISSEKASVLPRVRTTNPGQNPDRLANHTVVSPIEQTLPMTKGNRAASPEFSLHRFGGSLTSRTVSIKEGEENMYEEATTATINTNIKQPIIQTPSVFSFDYKKPSSTRSQYVEHVSTTRRNESQIRMSEKSSGRPSEISTSSTVESILPWVQWSAWSAWGQCTVTCGQGRKVRRRECQMKIEGAIIPAESCFGFPEEVMTCEVIPCRDTMPPKAQQPIVPTWTDWSEWGRCSVSCGQGARIRFRECKRNPAAADSCHGDDRETENCFSQTCPDTNKQPITFNTGIMQQEPEETRRKPIKDGNRPKKHGSTLTPGTISAIVAASLLFLLMIVACAVAHSKRILRKAQRKADVNDFI